MIFVSRDTLSSLGDIVSVASGPDGVTFTGASGALLRLTFVSASVIRVRLLPPGGDFELDSSYAVQDAQSQREEVFVEEAENSVEIITMSGVRVVVLRKDGLLSIFDQDGRLVSQDFQRSTFDSANAFVESTKRRKPDEIYFGFGEKAKSISRDRQTHVMWNTDTYAYPPGTDPLYQSIPFFIGLRQGIAHGIFFDNTYRSFFDMGETSEDLYRLGAAGGQLNYYVFTGGRERSPRNILRDYTSLTGRSPLPPVWALGYQQSRWSYYPEARVRELARRFRESRIPADVIYLDIDYMNDFRVFTWSPTHFPEPKQLISDLKNEGFRLVLIIDPGIKVDEDFQIYREGRDQGHFCQTESGEEFQGQVWPGTCAFPDFTNARTREWFGGLYQQYMNEGVSGFWNDMNEPSIFPRDDTQEEGFDLPQKTFPLSVRHEGDGHPGDHARYHNIYGMQMARTTYEAVKRHQPGRRPLVLTRAGFAGVQRYSAVWTGDNVASWEHLALSIPMLCNLGISGVPFVGADVGGFSGEPSGELFTRWLQAAALTPFCRSHAEIGTGDQEPWSYGEEFEAINRASIELRYQLLPFLYSLFYDHEETGAPVMRPLWFEYPRDEQTYLIEDQFLVGRDLLVAPVVCEGAAKRNVYFPNGDRWVDWWTGHCYQGGAEAEIDAPLEKLPLFARAGSSLPIQPIIQHTGEMALVPLGIAVVVGDSTSKSYFYYDAGDGFDYQHGNFSVMNIEQSKGTLTFKRSGAFDSPRQLGYVELLGLDPAAQHVRVNGQSVKDVTFQEENRRLLVRLCQSEGEWILTYSE
jgi:alpha-glucosidase